MAVCKCQSVHCELVFCSLCEMCCKTKITSSFWPCATSLILPGQSSDRFLINEGCVLSRLWMDDSADNNLKGLFKAKYAYCFLSLSLHLCRADTGTLSSCHSLSTYLKLRFDTWLMKFGYMREVERISFLSPQSLSCCCYGDFYDGYFWRGCIECVCVCVCTSVFFYAVISCVPLRAGDWEQHPEQQEREKKKV